MNKNRFKFGATIVEARADRLEEGNVYSVFTDDGPYDGPQYYLLDQDRDRFTADGLGDINFIILQILKVEMYEQREELWEFGREIALQHGSLALDIPKSRIDRLFSWMGMNSERLPFIVDAFSRARGRRLRATGSVWSFDRIDNNPVLGHNTYDENSPQGDAR